jgi:hypothetical protein
MGATVSVPLFKRKAAPEAAPVDVAVVVMNITDAVDVLVPERIV